ncbi:LamG domain-containing protein [Reichenbachiella versicolor]|uniref:hypothetical protein n=1 Tax=Reichenbachiella versicolor TaxID=1821036 RepID=UPI000D6E10E7|nr:hypothetical protein [Reichenbachiella versicolor]
MKNLYKAVALVLLPIVTQAQTVSQLPSGTKENYVNYRDASISDEFNSKKLDNKKWARRNTGNETTTPYINDKSLVQMEKEGRVQYVSIKAERKDDEYRTAGIVSAATGYYGFYVTRFRYRGVDTPEVKKKRTVWHPSIWGARLDNVEGKNRTSCPPDFWLELDFMEWKNGSNGWGSHTNARMLDSKGKRRNIIPAKHEKAEMKDHADITDDRWQTIGLEYSPEHLKLWLWEDGQWKEYGDRVVNFVEDNNKVPESKYTQSSIGKKSRTPVFWILGNIVARYIYRQIQEGKNQRTSEDMSFDIDFFRYYRHIEAVDMDWAWENDQPTGSKQILKDESKLIPTK